MPYPIDSGENDAVVPSSAFENQDAQTHEREEVDLKIPALNDALRHARQRARYLTRLSRVL